MKKQLFILLLIVLSINIAFANKTIGNTDTSIILPKGFYAKIIANGIGRARHIAITPLGTMYVKTSNLFKGKGIWYLKDLNADGIVDTAFGFCNYVGTGIAIKNGYLYASSNQEVFRYKLNSQYEVINPDAPEKIITGLLDRRQHESKSIALDNAGNIYVNIGAYSNSCQVQDRTLNSPGKMPCPVLDSAGGIWIFKADKLNQTYVHGKRYATGLRNVVGLDWNTQNNTLFVMQHGRDQLNQNWPSLYDEKTSAELPAECMYELKDGVNCGWPYIYYDHIQKKKILAHEYGGDGKKEGGADAINPAIAFPGHLAPNAILFYTGNQFPEKYKNGAFIAFHGSWNRSPLPQKGYFVVFVPFKDGKPTGDWEIFADNFAGKAEINSTRQADHRPCGLAQDANGNLFVTDDSKGTIYKINYTGK